MLLWEDTMKVLRRRFLHLAAGAAALPAVSPIAWAQAYPTRPVRIVIPFGPGGSGDIVARLMGRWASEQLGQPFIIENRPGASTNIAVETVVRAPSDGYTLLLIVTANAVNATLHQNLSFNFIRDIAPVAGINTVPFAMLVNPSFPARTVPEFIAHAKANPGKVIMASSGVGVGPHMNGELFKLMAGVDMLHVPYRGGDAPALTDLIGGQVDVYFGTVAGSIEQIKAGKLRALAVTPGKRLDLLPDTPTIGEFVPGYEASGWQGLGAPRNTPAEIIDKLNGVINAGLANATIKARLAELTGSVLAGSPADFRKLIVDETEKWARVIRSANIKLE
jgi:tripartite-type tricarboxylate transporter receptor subunit TctC